MPSQLWKKSRRELRRNLMLRFRHIKMRKQRLKLMQKESTRLWLKLRLRLRLQHRLSYGKPRSIKLRSGLTQSL